MSQNQKSKRQASKDDRETIIFGLFAIEAGLFIFSGYCFGKGSFKYGLIALLFALIMAWITGKEIENNAIQKYKEKNGKKIIS